MNLIELNRIEEFMRELGGGHECCTVGAYIQIEQKALLSGPFHLRKYSKETGHRALSEQIELLCLSLGQQDHIVTDKTTE